MRGELAVGERELIIQAQAGNEEAYGLLYQRHLAAVYTYIQRRVTNTCEAEDLAQTVFLKAWQAIRHYQATGAPFRSWLYRIAHNAVIDHYRSQRQSVTWDALTYADDPEHGPESIMLTYERHESVRNALATLRPTYQTILHHRFFDDKDYAETAAAVNRQINNVRVLQHRALDALQRTLRQEKMMGLALVTLVMSFLLGTTVVQAATQALPAEMLYPLRTWIEEGQLALADEQSALQLHIDFANRRMTDLERLSQAEQLTGVDETVNRFAAHITLAAAQLASQNDRNPMTDNETAHFTQLLQQQALALTTLRDKTPTIEPTVLQPALEAINAAQHQLQTETEADDPHTTAPIAPAILIATATPTNAVLPPLMVEQGDVVLHSTEQPPTPTPAALPSGVKAEHRDTQQHPQPTSHPTEVPITDPTARPDSRPTPPADHPDNGTVDATQRPPRDEPHSTDRQSPPEGAPDNGASDEEAPDNGERPTTSNTPTEATSDPEPIDQRQRGVDRQSPAEAANEEAANEEAANEEAANEDDRQPENTQPQPRRADGAERTTEQQPRADRS